MYLSMRIYKAKDGIEEEGAEGQQKRKQRKRENCHFIDKI
jgi:hypothetical protein